MNTLSLNNVCCERDERVLFAGLSAEIRAGDIVQIVGPNGAGKTSLLRLLTGISSQYEGEISWNGRPVPHYEFNASLLYFGHLPGVNSALTPLENLEWYFGLNGVKSADSIATDADKSDETLPRPAPLLGALAEVGLAGYENVPSYHMSAGQQRRVALARLFLSKACLWILDEPFTAIDKNGVAQLEAKIVQHAEEGGIVVLTTHQAPQVSGLKVIDLADYVVALENYNEGAIS